MKLKKYLVSVDVIETYNREIEATSKEEAEELFFDDCCIDGVITYTSVDEIGD